MGAVKVFISSLISGYEPYRTAVVEAVETLGHQVLRAQDFPATPGTPQQACLAGVRESDLVVLLIVGSGPLAAHIQGHQAAGPDAGLDTRTTGS
jgi:hypothetical protein